MNKHVTVVALAFCIMGLLVAGTLVVRAANLAGCRRDNVLRGALRASTERAYQIRVATAHADGRVNVTELRLAQVSRTAALKAYAAHGC